MNIDKTINIRSLERLLENFWDIAKAKVKNIEREYDESQGSPVFTVKGKYQSKGWTEWTQGFQYGIPLLVFDALNDNNALVNAKNRANAIMAPHLSHFGVHDHGFNNLSTYGHLLRMINDGTLEPDKWEKNYYELALKMSGSVQAKRYTKVKDGGYLYSFNGPHSLFIDTIRTCRILNVADLLQHKLLDENDRVINLHQRAVEHGLTTAKYAVYYGEGRDGYDEWGRVAHESIFNTNDGNYRCPNSQQGFSGFTTWTRGLSWAMLGFSEFLEFERDKHTNNSKELEVFLKAAKATCDFYIKYTALDGVPYWDAGAPQLYKLGDYQSSVSNPYNEFEPVDSSAAAIAAQGLLRLGSYLKDTEPEAAKIYFQAGLTVTNTLLNDPYISIDAHHQGLLLHTIYHKPNNWDYIPEGSKISYGESSMWGDYHLVELAYYLWKMIKKDEYYSFFKGLVS